MKEQGIGGKRRRRRRKLRLSRISRKRNKAGKKIETRICLVGRKEGIIP